MSSLEGINGTIFMYGQTGSGKTFTMLGADNFGLELQRNRNLTPRGVNNYNKPKNTKIYLGKDKTPRKGLMTKNFEEN